MRVVPGKIGLLAAASIATASAASTSTKRAGIKGNAISGVIKTLKTLLKNSEKDSKEKADLYDKTACDCRDDMRTYTEQFEMAQKEIDRLDAIEEELTAKKDALVKRIAKYKTSKSDLEASIQAEFTEKLNSEGEKAVNFAEETTTEQDAAIEELKSINQPYLKEEISGDTTLLDTTKQECEERVRKLDAMMAACDKVLTLMQDSSSKAVVTMVTKLRKHAFDRKTEIQQGEDECQAKIHDLEEAISSNQGFLDLSIAASEKLEAELSDTKGKLGETQSALVDEKEIRTTAKKGVAETTETCQKAAVAYDASTKLLTAEISGLTGAIAALQKVPAPAGESFLQLGSDDKELRQRVANVLKSIASSAAVLHSSRLSSVALQMNLQVSKPDYFKSVRNLIETMVTRLEDEQDAETSKSDWCAQSLQKMKGASDDADTDHQAAVTLVKDTEALLVKLNTEFNEETTEKETLETDLAALEKLMGEKDSYYKDLLEEKVSGEAALQEAIGFLKEIYGESATGDFSSQRTTSGGSVIDLLTGIESDYSWAADQAKMESGCVAEDSFETRKGENIGCDGVIVDGDKNYESEQYKNQERKETMEKDIAECEKEIERLTGEIDTEKVNLEKYQEQQSTKKGALETAKEILKARQEACVNAGDQFEARKKRREEEIASLKDALQILETHSKDAEENDMGTLSGFLQTRKAK
ncbi:unnamed protein product [Amoebophrya sp. A120]|nr:unnamed protein product [Amoebophrya sp. A120]|eukprot:GSA120T00004404001.1